MPRSKTSLKGGTALSSTPATGSTLNYPGATIAAPPTGSYFLMEDGVTPIAQEGGTSAILLETVAAPVITKGAYNGASAIDLTGYTTKNLVTDFGADPTGATDSYAAILAWLNCVGTNIDLYAPAGTYRSSKHLTPFARSNRIFRGAGSNLTTFRMTSDGAANNDSAIQLVGWSNVRVQDFKIYCPNTTARQLSGNLGYGLYGESCSNLTIQNVIADNIPAGSIIFSKSTDINIFYSTVQNGWADGFHFTGPGTARCLVQYCKGTNMGDDCYASIAYSGYQLSNIQFLDNEAYDCYWSNGVHFTGTVNGKALRNKLYRNGMGGIEVTTDNAYSNSSSDNIEIANNYIEGAVTRGASTGHASIYCYAAGIGGSLTNISVHDNTIFDPYSGAGIKTLNNGVANGSVVSITADNNTLTNDGSGGMSTPVSVGANTTLLYQGRGNTYNGAAL